MVIKKHHIWCNRYFESVEGCKECERLYKEFPLDNLTPDEALKKYFPNVTVRTK